MSEEILDAEELLEECDGDLAMLARWVEIFERDCDDRLPKLLAAVETGDSQTILEQAHAIKGSVGTFFAAASFETAYQLETMGRLGELDDASSTLATLQTQVAELRGALQDLLKGDRTGLA